MDMLPGFLIGQHSSHHQRTRGHDGDTPNWASSEPLEVPFANPVVILCSMMRQERVLSFLRFFLGLRLAERAKVKFSVWFPKVADGVRGSRKGPLHLT